VFRICDKLISNFRFNKIVTIPFEIRNIFLIITMIILMSIRLTQIDRKVTQPIPDTTSICQRTNHIKIKNSVLLCWKSPPCSIMHAFTLFLISEVKNSCSNRKSFTRRSTVYLFGTGESGNVTLNSLWPVKKKDMRGRDRK
jgi:hypothetical protein